VYPAQAGGMRQLKQRELTPLLQTMRIVIIPQKYVAAGVLFSKHQKLVLRVKETENHVLNH
jgi:hypothetical protein